MPYVQKVNTNDSRGMILFRCDVDRVPWHRFQTNIYLFKVNNIYTRTRCGICSISTICSTECRRANVFIDEFEYISLLILVFLLLTLGLLLFDRPTADLVTLTDEILNGKLHFLCSVMNIPQHNHKSFLLTEQLCF